MNAPKLSAQQMAAWHNMSRETKLGLLDCIKFQKETKALLDKLKRKMQSQPLKGWTYNWGEETPVGNPFVKKGPQPQNREEEAWLQLDYRRSPEGEPPKKRRKLEK